ncbi:hypothetical protein [Pustulibacterium marinum]|uniref:hypothetical protein n=1 Tax=Pustulibacterium marinum TaxID=1224947 RepID=UPI000B876A36|nr:hypothetical protein [Pustulibacterium marinum]
MKRTSQYTTKTKLTIIKGGNPKLSKEIKGKYLGGKNGNIKANKVAVATRLFITKINLSKRESFFKVNY